MSNPEHSHLIDPARMARIEARAETYLHIAKRMIVEQFGPEAGREQVLVTVTLAAAMANLETAEIIASSQDGIVGAIEEKEI